ncbi:MAG TPA: Asp-tRNA(Asn)/Glu-tRNA(Gln) amidotransferase subunit GatC [Candidatus Limnocylindria bacterium]|nr:Asp-tRNA(Asn)/Glu-tRNA(Gln) amidotransferase subunit GatC [Candidatus Limnocylindria bacterium]
MPITRDDVRRSALLARLSLTPAEEERFTADLSHILDAFTTLQALPTEDVEVMRPLDSELAPLRDDVVTNPPAADALLAGAPDLHGRLFHVPKIIE